MELGAPYNKMQLVKWVLIPKFCELTGYTTRAVNTKIDKGVWAQGIHWKKSKDGHRFINLVEFDKWIDAA